MIARLVDYFKNSIAELKLVVWPGRRDLVNHTLLVIGISLGVAFFLGIIDYGLTKLLEILIK